MHLKKINTSKKTRNVLSQKRKGPNIGPEFSLII